MTSGNAYIHILPASVANEEDRKCLNEEEAARAESFRFVGDSLRWIAFRASLRRALGAFIGVEPRLVPIILTEFGKPVLAPPFDFLHFNLSHCNDMALIALCFDGPVGVDIEPTCRAADLIECESTFCHPCEIRELPLDSNARSNRLMAIWTAKEALLKALGTGFALAPETVRIGFDSNLIRAECDPPHSGSGSQVIRRLNHPLLDRHCAAVSTADSVSRIEYVVAGSTSVHSLV